MLNETHRIFIEKNANVINNLVIDTSIINEYDQDFLELGVVTRITAGDVKLHTPTFWVFKAS